jgi:hypothetical protein
MTLNSTLPVVKIDTVFIWIISPEHWSHPGFVTTDGGDCLISPLKERKYKNLDTECDANDSAMCHHAYCLDMGNLMKSLNIEWKINIWKIM